MKITKVSIFTQKSTTLDLDITEEQYAAWKGGVLIQKAMPNLTPDEREFLITGTAPGEWEKMMTPPKAPND